MTMPCRHEVAVTVGEQQLGIGGEPAHDVFHDVGVRLRVDRSRARARGHTELRRRARRIAFLSRGSERAATKWYRGLDGLDDTCRLLPRAEWPEIEGAVVAYDARDGETRERFIQGGLHVHVLRPVTHAAVEARRVFVDESDLEHCRFERMATHDVVDVLRLA